LSYEASVGAAARDLGGQSILHTPDTRMASPLYVTAHDASNVPVERMISDRYRIRGASVCRFLAGGSCCQPWNLQQLLP
jgi:hypothetical protein